ncbi:unnamed protein product [Rotaria magnacalcarata]|uniref:NIPSNAP domain-containing protein n=2 Tax=Rotaria magnacalcarata TaxID=392030 RepID=A0A816LDX8_9BILA|nr:unnamed protein product [Rotaria magnacalcarata]CAF1935643.1 unnamed protein product [Rotaria magnacalcarata]CAF1999351.1 unnamed protein product [Rotaria magnacalcarata]CAF2095217.1 unnamed protein product [Rotaria magnacalcarata]CAF3838333.1 unnamed protein product [Rotaria magnacalcarata]
MHSSTTNTLRLISIVQSTMRKTINRTLFNTFTTKPIEKAKDAHSNLLTDTDHVFELQHHTVKPSAMNDYESMYCDYASQILDKYSSTGLVHTGSWRVHIGNVQNQFVHIWMYKNFTHLDQFMNNAKNSSIDDKLNQYIIERSNQMCLSFSYFGIPQPRAKSDDEANPYIYEMRSYWLKPGTLIEWGNLWHKGVQHRPDAKVLGVFSQIGDLYNVHHMWSYKNFQHRKKMRTNAWAKPGWSENVEFTVPLVRKMESKILVPLKISPLQ